MKEEENEKKDGAAGAATADAAGSTGQAGLLKRIMIYLIGIIVLALGITLNTKTNLGVSPVISVAYCAADLTGVAFGAATFIQYMILIGLQVLILRKRFKLWQLLQIGASFLTSWFIDFYDRVLPQAQSMPVRLVLLAAAVVITACGIILTVGMEIVPNPADGFASVLGTALGKNLGFGKNLLDLICILCAVILGYVVKGQLIGIGIGTVLTMIFTGRVVAFINRWTGPICRKVVEESRK